MVQELLSIHEVEGKIVTSPNPDEKSGISQHSITDRVFDRVEPTSSGQRIGTHNTNKDRECDDTYPPTDDVSDQVDLFFLFVVGPEADTAEHEWPVERPRRVRVVRGQSCIMLQHEDLKLNKFLEKVDMFNRFVLNHGRPVTEIVASAIGHDLVDVPDVGLIQLVLVAIDFLLAGSPVG